MHFNSIWESFEFLTVTHKIPMDTDLLFIIGVMSDSVHSLVLVMNSPSSFPGLSYIDYKFILYIYLYIYLWIFKEAKKPLWTFLEIPFPSTPLQSCHWTRIISLYMALFRSKLGFYLLSYVTPMLTVDIGNYVSLFIN